MTWILSFVFSFSVYYFSSFSLILKITANSNRVCKIILNSVAVVVVIGLGNNWVRLVSGRLSGFLAIRLAAQMLRQRRNARGLESSQWRWIWFKSFPERLRFVTVFKGDICRPRLRECNGDGEEFG